MCVNFCEEKVKKAILVSTIFPSKLQGYGYNSPLTLELEEKTARA
jgi:hypothetical protein